MFRTMIAVGIGFLGILFELSCNKDKTLAVHTVDPVVNASSVDPVVNASSAENVSKPQREALPPEVEALNAIQREISVLNEQELLREEEILNKKMRENNLLDKMNTKVANEEEKELGKKILIRLALIRIEKGKREAQLRKAQNNKD